MRDTLDKSAFLHFVTMTERLYLSQMVTLYDHEMWIRGVVSSQPLKGHTRLVRCLAFVPQGRITATVSDEQAMRLWDGDTGEAINQRARSS